MTFFQKPRGKFQGIIIWDFDRVLFDTESFSRKAEGIFKDQGITPEIFEKALNKLKKDKLPFSLTGVMRNLRSFQRVVKEKKIRQDLHKHLKETKYFNSLQEGVLRSLLNKGFKHIILSYGYSSYQRKKILIGCGEKFAGYFSQISTTVNPKFIHVKKLGKKFPETRIFFVDDKRENLALVKRNVPKVVTICYSNRKSLKNLEKRILSYASKK